MFYLKIKMNNNFKLILINVLIIKNYKGVWLLLSVWMMFDNRLNVIGVSILLSIICKNVCVFVMIFVGVCINNKIWLMKINDRIVKMILIIRLIMILIVKLCCIVLKLCVLKCWVVNMDKLVVNFCVKLMIKNWIFLVDLIVVRVLIFNVWLMINVFDKL